MTAEDFKKARLKMVRQQLKARDIHHPRLLKAMEKVERHEFVPPEVRALAYQDHPLAIGEDQTISQPYIVALMTQLADPQPGDRALEVGTGSGYQAAVLAELVEQVYTIEIIPSLAQRAAADLARLGYDRVQVRQGDGYEGWPEQAPFDIILVTAAADDIPQPLLDQLADGGRLVIPVGDFRLVQDLILVRRRGDKLEKRSITTVRFVPMTGRIQRQPSAADH